MRTSAGSVVPRVKKVALLDGEPVVLADLKSMLKMTGSAEDAFLTTLLKTTRAMVERLTGRSLPRQTLQAAWDGIPHGRLEWWDGTRDGAIGMDREAYVELPLPPLVSVSYVRAYQDDDTYQTMPATDYFVSTSDQDLPGRVVLRVGATWPVFIRPRDGFVAQYTAGYDHANAADANVAAPGVPPELKHVILLMASWLYRNRGDSSGDARVVGASGAMSILDEFVIRTARS